MDEQAMTHKGWFWFCPIFLSPEAPDCVVEARYLWMEPLLTVAEWLERARIGITSFFDPDYEPMFMFLVTGEIRQARL
jgi:hypothetical protein